ncbi:MAG TPA: hypothetical protein VFT22_23075 [Kofleriaceae bacterium]|nr:hypothetical protein [Kofleriaceae bacterium]
MHRWAIALAGLLFAARAHAEPSWRAGLDVHGTDAALGERRPLGIAGGVRYGQTEGAIVIDPLVLVLGWEMLDVTLGRWIAGDRVELVGGWRQTSGPLASGRRYDEAVLVGADWTVPLSSRFRLAFGLELETSIWRHGGRIEGDVIQLLPPTVDTARRVELLLHARFDVTGAL